jgi:hypothetical protein
VETFGLLIKFKMALPWKPRYQNNGVLQINSGRHPTPLFWYLGFHGNAILNFINKPKVSTHYGEYSYAVS